MKNISYKACVHLDQNHGKIVEAICNCSAEQRGVCKHVAAIRYTMLDYLHLGLQEIPPDITCTQAAQKWHVPSTANLTVSSKLDPAMQVVVNGIKQPVIHALFQTMENNIEKFMGSNDAIEISQNV